MARIESHRMSTRDYGAALGRLRQLVKRGPAPGSARTATGRAKNLLRSGLLRLLRPYTYYAHEVDAAVLSCLAAYEDEGRRLARLGLLAEDLVAAAEALRRRVAHGEGRLSEVAGVVAELHSVPYLADPPFEVFGSPMGEVLGYRNGRRAAGESACVAFAEMFRGPAERVAELQRPYLKLVSEHQPVLDLGCGRGEFLALLADEGIAGRGVDSDPGMVARCAQHGLPVEQADAVDYLEGLADGSAGTIFSAQVIEHLPAERLQRLVELALRKLRPGGLFIAETVNPHSVQAMKAFWVDPTHRRPIFPEVALAMCAIAGFHPAYVFAPGYQSFEQARFSSPAYAVVATRPAG
jgi:hypothetical protein